MSDPTGGSPVAPPTILVVEDEALIQLDVVAILEEAGFATIAVPDGDPAIAALESADSLEIIRAVITDIDLHSTLTGWDIARRARELNPTVPVIYMSGAKVGDWSAQGVPNSVMIAKPFASAQIVTALSQLLNASPPSDT